MLLDIGKVVIILFTIIKWFFGVLKTF